MKTAAGVILAVPVLVIGLVVLLGGASSSTLCGDVGTATAATVNVASVGKWSGRQLTNAATIINVAAQKGMSTQAAVIAVMTAMGESSLTNETHGDGAINPDGSASCSLGLFQQQWCLPGQPWGDKTQVMDPAHAAGAFLAKLAGVTGWQNLPATIAAHRVQGNSDPNFYAQFESDAQKVVAALSGSASSSTTCTAGYTPANGTAPGPWGGYQNGQIPLSALVKIPWTSGPVSYSAPWTGSLYLRADAEASLVYMDAAFKAHFGYDIPMNDAYRALAAQQQDKATYGGEAATPGTSNHGWGLAIDIGDQSHDTIGYGDPEYLWLKANAGRYGWVHPAWAEPGGSGPHEAWHWEYYGVARSQAAG